MLDRLAPAVFVFLWSTGWIAAGYAAIHSEPFTFLAWRYGLSFLAFAALCIVAGARWPRDWRQALKAVYSGIFLHGLYLAGLWWAVARGVPAGLSGIIAALQPLLTAVAAASLLGERLSRLQKLGLALGFLGIAIAISPKLTAIDPGNLGQTAVPLVVNLLGDFVSGGLHPELAKTDAEEVLPTVLRCVDLLVWGLRQIADAFGQVYVPCASGNHGRATQKPEFKRYIYKNFDWLIYQLVARAFEGDRRLVFDIPDTNEVHYRVFGQRYLAMHGDMLGVKGGDGIIGSLGPIARGETKVGKQASALGLDYDVLVIGHWHQMIWLPRVIVSGTLKGWDEYARSALRAPPSPPCQPLWFVHPRRGITSRWEIRVDEPGDGAGEEWVSFRRAA